MAPAASSGVPMRFKGIVSSAAISLIESPPGIPRATCSPPTVMLCPSSLPCKCNAAVRTNRTQ